MSNAYEFIIGHAHFLIFVFYSIGVCCRCRACFLVALWAVVAGPYEYWSATCVSANGSDLETTTTAINLSSSLVRTEMILFLSLPFVVLHEILFKD